MNSPGVWKKSDQIVLIERGHNDIAKLAAPTVDMKDTKHDLDVQSLHLAEYENWRLQAMLNIDTVAHAHTPAKVREYKYTIRQKLEPNHRFNKSLGQTVTPHLQATRLSIEVYSAVSKPFLLPKTVRIQSKQNLGQHRHSHKHEVLLPVRRREGSAMDTIDDPTGLCFAVETKARSAMQESGTGISNTDDARASRRQSHDTAERTSPRRLQYI
jgi:hypothetical protein